MNNLILGFLESLEFQTLFNLRRAAQVFPIRSIWQNKHFNSCIGIKEFIKFSKNIWCRCIKIFNLIRAVSNAVNAVKRIFGMCQEFCWLKLKDHPMWRARRSIMLILLRIHMSLGNVTLIHTDPSYIFDILERLCTEFLNLLMNFPNFDEFINL